jgi:uncharacterized protein YqjF (DUF2071 family)
MAQTWRDLLFAHWTVPAEALRALVPEPLTIDRFDGSGWLGITPFEVSGMRLRGTPPLPWVSRFPELNVRTYVSLGGKPGIWFFSLDAARALAVAAARVTYRLPYFHARMTIARQGDRLHYRSRRSSSEREIVVDYAPTGGVRAPLAGTLEHWLTERYCLYTADEHRGVMRAEIHHPPWPLQEASADVATNTMAPGGIALVDAPLLHFARRQDVVIWPPRPAGA